GAAQDAVYASRTLSEMKSAEVSSTPGTSKMRQVGSKVFTDKDGAWVDSVYDPNAKLAVVDLVFGSEELLKAVTADAQLASYAALGKNVTVVHKGKVYRIHT